MTRFRTTLNFVITFATIFGLMFVIGCGGTSEKHAMTEFLQQYSKSVDEYAAADQSAKVEIEKKLDSYDTQWTDMKIDMGSLVTPQVLTEMDNEYHNITERYASIAKNHS